MIRIVANEAARAAADAAQWIASALREDIAARGVATLAISGGSTPQVMLQALARQSLPWTKLRVAQVDERIVPPADARRNFLMQHAALVTHGPLPAANLLGMPADNLEHLAMQTYSQLLGRLDIVQLGLGADGHTASLVPNDPALRETQLITVTDMYQGTRRMTLTFPAINAARRIVWLVTGESKRAALQKLLAGEGTSPALQVRRTGVVVFADAAAAGDVATA